jgi:FkbM family methyltransferase
MSFVDCGAFVGDTLSDVAALEVGVDAVYAFEPDVSNFGRLARYGSEFAAATGARVALWPCAVAGASGVVRFHSEGGETGHLASDGEGVVTAVALDDALPSVPVTDLKMDIEGAELDALRGAERTIRRTRPRLAICVYHRAEHLWEIPLFVRDLDLGYDFYLRSHGHYGFDVVMYAVPRSAR